MAIPKSEQYNTFEDFLILAETSQERMEYINGEIVYLAAPTTLHQRIVGKIFVKISNYISQNHGKCEPFVAPFDVQLGKNQVQPDVLVVCDPEEKLTDKKCIGAPDWIIEVVSSNYWNDYFRKLELYKNSGVREYWIVDPEEEKVLVYFFEQNNNVILFYDFTQPIPVNIYKDAPVQLSICISELL